MTAPVYLGDGLYAHLLRRNGVLLAHLDDVGIILEANGVGDEASDRVVLEPSVFRAFLGFVRDAGLVGAEVTSPRPLPSAPSRLERAAARLVAAEDGCNRSIALFPLREGVRDSEEGASHWSAALREKEAAVAEVIAAHRDATGVVTCACAYRRMIVPDGPVERIHTHGCPVHGVDS